MRSNYMIMLIKLLAYQNLLVKEYPKFMTPNRVRTAMISFIVCLSPATKRKKIIKILC